MRSLALAAAVVVSATVSFGFQKALILKQFDDEGVRRVKENGFDGAEVRLHGETVAEAEAARRLADANGVKIHSVMANGWYAFDDEAKYDAALAQAKEEIAVAAAYGVDTMLVVSGSRRSPEKRYVKLTAEEQAKVDAATRRAFAELVPLAGKAGVCLALEFVWNNAWADPEAYAAFVRSFDSPWVKIYLDLGNGLKFAPVEKWISAAGKDIRRVHIKDFELDPSVPRCGEFVAIGTGDVDFALAKRALDAVGYDGWVSIEETSWTDAQYARLVDWFSAGAPEGDLVGNWTFDLPPASADSDPNLLAGWLGVTKDSVGYSSRCLWRCASPWRTPWTSVKNGAVRIMRLADGRKSPGSCDYDLIRARVVGNELYASANTYAADGKLQKRGVRFVGRRLPPVGPAPALDSLAYGEKVDLLANGLDDWRIMSTNKLNGWSFKDGVLSNTIRYDEKGHRVGGFSNILSKRADFYDFKISYDVKMPKDGNSGVYLRGIYEIQSRESYGMKPDSHNMGAYYGRVTPLVAAEKPADVWQHVDAILAERHIWVWLNGTLIVDACPVEGITGGALSSDEFKPGPIYIQGDHSNASYRNMILTKIVASSDGVRKALDEKFVPFQADRSSYTEVFEEVCDADRAADRAWRQLKTQAEYDAYRTAMKAKMIEAIGGFPEKTPLGAEVTKTYRRDGYTVEKVLFQSSPGVYVTGQFYRPDDTRFKAPFPAVVVSCGHAREGMACCCYQRACVDLVKRGIAGFIFEAMGQGERKQYAKEMNTQAHNAIGVPAMLLGDSMAKFRIWDGVRAIDYVVSRPDVDGARIGYEGQSGGGTMTSLMMAVDDRIKAAAPSCYLTNLRELADHMGPQDAEQNIFGQLSFGLNHLGFILMQDIPVMVVCKKQDGFDYYGTGETFDQLMELAATLGKTERYFKCAQPGPHGWIESTRAASALWMDRWLQGSKVPIDLPALRVLDYGRNFDREMRAGREDGGLPMDDGYVTPNASVLELPDAKSIFTVMEEKLAKIEKARPMLSAAEKQALMRTFAKVRTPAEANCRVVSCGETKRDGLSVRRFLVCHPKGLNLPAVLLTPEGASGTPVLVVHPKGRAAAAAEVKAALAAKRAVLAVDCLGTGEVGGSKHVFYGATDTPEEGLAMMLYWLGDSLVARRATDLLVAADVCAKLTGAKPELVAFGTYAVPAAHAFATDRAAFAKVTLREPSKTWTDLVHCRKGHRFETCVNGALLRYDWPELLK